MLRIRVRVRFLRHDEVPGERVVDVHPSVVARQERRGVIEELEAAQVPELVAVVVLPCTPASVRVRADDQLELGLEPQPRLFHGFFDVGHRRPLSPEKTPPESG